MDRENLPELPTGWVQTQLGDIVHPYDEKVEPLTIQEIPYVGLEHIEKDTGKLLGFGHSNEVRSTKSKFYSGDLLYGKLRPYLNKVHLVNFDGVCSTDILVFSKAPHISTKYLSFCFLCRDFVNYASQNVNGVQHPRVNFQTLAEFPIALPPLNEQRRIVAKIEALKARSQQVKEALEAIPSLLDQFRQSVLAAAFRGDLTADWREKNLDVEPASVLLERIRAERRRRWEEAELKRMKANGKMPTDDKWKSKYKEPEPPNTSELPILPENWVWACVEQFADVGTGATPLRSEHKYYEGGEISWVTSGALNDLFINNAEECITPLAIEETNAKIFPKHTLLVAMYGEGKTRGKVSELLIDAATNQACAALVIEGLARKIRPIVKLFFQKNYSDLRLLASGGVQPNLNLSMIKATAVPLPPLEEQAEIIQVVNGCMSIADALEKQYLDNINLINFLDQSILAKAFRGELVPQVPNDEPASVLLERIQAERANREAEAKAAKKSTGNTNGRRSRKAQQQDSESIQLDLPGVE